MPTDPNTRSTSSDVLPPLQLRHVVVPVDGSAHADAAMPTARALAARTGADLVELDVNREGAAEEIVVVARALEPSAIALGTRARGRLAGALLGSTAREVLRSSSVPVIAVGPHADRPPALVGRRRRRPLLWPEPLSTPRLLAAVDGSSASELVLPVAAQWATALDMDLVIVTVAEDVPRDASGRQPNRFGPEDPEGYVDVLVRRWQTAARTVTGVVVRDPIGISSGLRQHLALEPTGLLAVATLIREGADRFRRGATAADIVRTSTVPVLSVPVSP